MSERDIKRKKKGGGRSESGKTRERDREKYVRSFNLKNRSKQLIYPRLERKKC